MCVCVTVNSALCCASRLQLTLSPLSCGGCRRHLKAVRPHVVIMTQQLTLVVLDRPENCSVIPQRATEREEEEFTEEVDDINQLSDATSVT